MIDTHCHLTFPEFSGEKAASTGGVGAVLARAQEHGVTGCITIATTTRDSAAALGVARAHPRVWCSAGVHPCYADQGPHDWDAMRACGRDPKCVAWGELGLDNHYEDPPKSVQRAVLEEQLAHIQAWHAEAARTGERHMVKPVIVHCREAFADLIPILSRTSLDPSRFVFHCFTGESADMSRILDFGASVSFTGVVTYQNAPELRKAALLPPPCKDHGRDGRAVPLAPPAPGRAPVRTLDDERDGAGARAAAGRGVGGVPRSDQRQHARVLRGGGDMTRSTRDPIRCVCFDWGGVILRHCRSWDEACALTGIPVRGETMDPQRVQARRELNMLYATGRVSCEEFFSRLTHLHDGRYSEQEVRTLHHAWLTTEYEGLGAIISRLNAMGTIETALLSNTCHAHWQRHLAGEGQAPDYPTIALLKHRHASHLLGFAKPDERIYRAFEEQTGFVGAEILFFDDLPDNIRAAGERGWRGVLVDYTKETAPQVIAGLREHGVWEEQSAERG